MIRSSRKIMAVIIILISVWLIVYLPPYEKLTYSKSEACGYSEVEKEAYGFEGYKGGEDIPMFDAGDMAVSIRDDHSDFFRLKINAADLRPMGIYRPAANDAAYTAYEINALKVIRHRAYDCCVYWHNYMDGNDSGAQAAVKVV